MKTAQRCQTIAHDAHRGLRLAELGTSVLSPYYQPSHEIGGNSVRDIRIIPYIMNLKALITGYSIGGAAPNVSVFFESDDSSIEAGTVLPISIAYSDNDVAIQAKVAAAINGFCSSASLPVPTIDWLTTTPTDLAAAIAASAVPMYVSGVAKTGYYAVVAAPAVAGGAGVARFYIDSNGDGTGTAPSAVFTGSLQAVVPSSTATYQLQSFTVDTNRKYIDVKMGTLSTGLAGIIPILTGAIGNTANGTAINCFVLVQK